MRKIKFLLLTTLCLLMFTKNMSSQVVKQGQVVVNGYYGINVFTAVLRAAYYQNSSTQQNFAIKGFGPIGGYVEYMMTDKIGIGIDGYYANTSITWNEQDYDANNNPIVYSYKVSIPRVGVLARANFHFSDSDVFDAYGIVAMGMKNVSYNATSTNPLYVPVSAPGLIPVAMKLGVGFRYFFTDDFGLNGEMALGTPLLAGGLSIKF